MEQATNGGTAAEGKPKMSKWLRYKGSDGKIHKRKREVGCTCHTVGAGPNLWINGLRCKLHRQNALYASMH